MAFSNSWIETKKKNTEATCISVEIRYNKAKYLALETRPEAKRCMVEKWKMTPVGLDSRNGELSVSYKWKVLRRKERGLLKGREESRSSSF